MLISKKLFLEEVKQEYFWEDTLPDFLKSSNEDQVITDLFNEWVIPVLEKRNYHSEINWLEIGCGDFYKTSCILKSLKTKLCPLSISLQVLEPSLIWVKNFVNRYGLKLQLDKVNFVETKLEDYVNQKQVLDFNIISIIHVLYEEDVTTAFFKFLDRLIIDNINCVIFVSIESVNSDFALIRQELLKAGFLIPESKHILLEKELNQRQLKFESIETVGKVCELNFNALNNSQTYWLFPFLLGISRESFFSWDNRKKNNAIQIIRDKIFCMKRKKLSINDKIFLIEL